MSADASLWAIVADAGTVVKFVMLVLVLASVLSWTLIFQRGFMLSRSRQLANQFEQHFWSGVDIMDVFDSLKARQANLSGMESIFYAGFEAFMKMREHAGVSAESAMDAVQRAMRVAQSRELDRLEQHLGFLATVGSTSPYVGLFGTVWGIMHALHSLGSVEQATLSMVAPGISETLIATAMGLFAAIPAYVAYNRYASELDRVATMYDNFQEEFYVILSRQAQSS